MHIPEEITKVIDEMIADSEEKTQQEALATGFYFAGNDIDEARTHAMRTIQYHASVQALKELVKRLDPPEEPLETVTKEEDVLP